MAQFVPWVEKYRPRCLEEVSHQEEALAMLKNVVESGNMPHLLFYGPPGSGKTSAILALAIDLFGVDRLKSRVLEMNASDDRGIAVIRDKIKSWSRYETGGPCKHSVTGRLLPNWKIVILDEADMMTHDAQSALRRIMESFSRTTRFVIICNYVHKIIDPLVSRCSVYRFQSISPDAQAARLRRICESENITLQSEKALIALQKVSQGDLRKAITLLQSASRCYEVLDETAVFEVAGQPPIEVAEKLLKACRTSQAKMEEAVTEILKNGWECGMIPMHLTELICKSDDPALLRARILIYIAERDYGILKGGSAYLDVLDIGKHICTVLNTQ